MALEVPLTKLKPGPIFNPGDSSSRGSEIFAQSGADLQNTILQALGMMYGAKQSETLMDFRKN